MLELVNRKLTISFLKGLWIYTLLLWAYIVADMFVFPQYQFAPISRLLPIPQDLLAIIAFPVSFLAFVGWEYARKLHDSPNSDESQGLRNDARARKNKITP